MNRNLVVFAVFLLILGAASNFYVLSLLGVLMLIPALLAKSRAPTRPTTPESQPTRRVSTPPARQEPPKRIEPAPSTQAPTMATTPPATTSAATATMQSQFYSPSLFPTSIFPSVSSYGSTPKQATEPKATDRDEVVEAGAILALLRLLMG